MAFDRFDAQKPNQDSLSVWSFVIRNKKAKRVSFSCQIWQRLAQGRLSSFAVLCKRSTALFLTKDRIQFAFKNFQTAIDLQVMTRWQTNEGLGFALLKQNFKL